MKKYIIGLGVLGALLLSGCGQPQPQPFNPNNKAMGFVNGKAYYIPVGSMHRVVSKEESRNLRATFNKTCPAGSILWFSPSFTEYLNNEEWKTKTEAQQSTAVNNAYRTGNNGCARPLNKQEYQYRLNQQNQRAANARASSRSHSNSYSTPSYTSSSNSVVNNSMASLSRPYSSGGPSSDWGNNSRKSTTYSVRRLNDNYYSVSGR